MMIPLSPYVAVAGGLLIGSAAGLFLLLTGWVAGVSGLTAIATNIGSGDTRWSQAVLFLVGLPLGTALVAAFVRAPVLGVTSSVPLLLIAGLLVGFGTRLGNGCTSGHGVCGIARLSRRSIAATGTFMVSAIATVFLVRHAVGG